MAEVFYLNDGTDPLAEASVLAPAALSIAMAWRFANGSDTALIGHRQRGTFAGLAAVGDFNSTAEPSGPPTFLRANWRTPAMFGVIPAGVWNFSLRLRGTGGTNSPSNRMRWRISRGRTPETATDISGVIVGVATGTIGSGTLVSSIGTWNAPAVRLNHERIFIHQAMEARDNLGTTGAGNTRDVNVVVGGNSFLSMPDLVPVEFVGAVML